MSSIFSNIFELGLNVYSSNKPYTSEIALLQSQLRSNLDNDKILLVTSNHTNVTPSSQLVQAGGFIGSGIVSAIAPQLGQSAGSAFSLVVDPKKQYSTTPRENLTSIPGLPYSDFRARRGNNIRLDGASAATRGSITAGVYAATTVTPGGAYTLFNRDAYYGLGDHGNPAALRKDFTAGSNVRTTWRGGAWKQTINPVDLLTPFRGDKVNVIDFGQRSLRNIYQWRPSSEVSGFVQDITKNISKLDPTLTRDLIKFYFTGPSLTAYSKTNISDDVIVFRAILNTLNDSFNPQWNPIQFIGRADKNYQYSTYDRTLSLDFTVYASDRDELKPIYRKLNALASYTAPTYSTDTTALVGPWMRVTIGDLFVHTPAFINSLTYTLADSETSWEINIEDDPTMMQVPQKVDVSLGLTIVADTLPQKNGNMYSLAKRYSSNNEPLKGNDNWLSDFKGSIEDTDKSIELELNDPGSSKIQTTKGDNKKIIDNTERIIRRK